VAIATVIQRITAPNGMNASLEAMVGPATSLVKRVDTANIVAQNVAPELAEQNRPLTYPSVSVYCDKITNSLTEKFRRFSGTVQVIVEIRHSQDRLEGLQDALQLYADSVTQVLAGC
jgi:hypothetical protein